MSSPAHSQPPSRFVSTPRSTALAAGLPALIAVGLAVALSGCIVSSEYGLGGRDPSIDVGDAKRNDHQNVTLRILSAPDRITPGETAEWRLQVRHEGPAGDAPFLYSSICVSPWQTHLQDATGQARALHEPMMVCMAYGEAELHPGDSLETTWSWNGTEWRDERYQELPPGDYSLIFRFASIRGEGDASVTQALRVD